MPITFTTSPEVPSNAQVVGVPVFAGRGLKSPTSSVELDRKYLERRGFEGKVGQAEALLADDGTTIVALGVGESGSVDASALRTAAAALARAGGQAKRVATTLLDAAPSVLAGGQAVAEGMALAAYDFSEYKSKASPLGVERVTVVAPKDPAVTAAVARGARVAAAANLARDLINTPAQEMTPSRLADEARAAGEAGGVSVSVWGPEEIAEERLGGLHGVALGSAEEARLIRLEYSPEGATQTVALVGKGITFDSGGLSLKTGDGMMTMKTDMSGAAAVIAAMSALRDLDVPVRVIGIVPATENMPGGRAIKPGDVLRFRNGKTAEVLNTDAEGRLVLADGLSLAAEERPTAIIDLATLTGACVVALGRSIAGVMGNDEALVGRVRAAADTAGEPVWPLPLPASYRKDIDSEIADMKNIGKAGAAGALVAGLFLQEFVDGVPWAHLDIAGPARAEADDGWIRRGGTGFGVRTLLELLSGFAPAGEPSDSGEPSE
ncbi:MAG TPA: leucyl aminopeptidase [Acidimicrobiales bacterium]|nr:leucyl aminopeptidase [Acidimicrobiales bacterium]